MEGPNLCEKVKELSYGIRALLKEGKITIHSVMAIWVGSPFGAAEAFKMSEQHEEVETKYSCAIFDVIEILQSLKIEDSHTFWNGGKKDSALRNLLPLATESVRLGKKLGRMTSVLENYTNELFKAMNIIQNSVMLTRQNLAEETVLLKNPKVGKCYRFRSVFRHAFNSLSGVEKKNSRALPQTANTDTATAEVKKENHPIPTTCPENMAQPDPAQGSGPEASSEVAKNTANNNRFIHVRPDCRPPERNKSDTAGHVRGGGCQCFRCQCAGFCGRPNMMLEMIPHRTRAIPSYIFAPEPPQCCCCCCCCNHQQNCGCSGCAPNGGVGPSCGGAPNCSGTCDEGACGTCCGAAGNCCQPAHGNCCHNQAGDNPRPCPCQCCHPRHDPQQGGHEEEEGQKRRRDGDESELKPLNTMESQPFEVSNDGGYETSYLKDFERIVHRGPPLNPNNNNLASDASKYSSGVTIPDKCTELTAVLNADVVNNNGYNNNLEGHQDPNSNEEELFTKEVIIVRSAVSGFAESEFGTIDSEDLDWLNKIKEVGQTGQICADDIERSEKLKRQSIFLNCIKYRTEETLKDVHNVLEALRTNERKWVEPSRYLKPVDGAQEGLVAMELGEIVVEILKTCQTIVRVMVMQFSTNTSNSLRRRGEIQPDRGDVTTTNQTNKYKGKGRKHKKDKKRVEPILNLNERDSILKLVESIHGETAAVHRSFKRFSRMVNTDVEFLKNLCLGFTSRQPSSTESSEGGEEALNNPSLPNNTTNNTSNNDKYVPVYIRRAKAQEARATNNVNLTSNSNNTTIPPTFNFHEIFA